MTRKLATRLRSRMLAGAGYDVVMPYDLADQIAEALEGHDHRVTELIRANSREVIRRREINAHRMLLLTLVSKLRDTLRGYARNHRDKIVNQNLTAQQTRDTLVKSERNDQLADECDEAILWESPTGAMGTP